MYIVFRQNQDLFRNQKTQIKYRLFNTHTHTQSWGKQHKKKLQYTNQIN